MLWPLASGAPAAAAGAPEANGQSIYLKLDGVKGEAKFHKGETAIQDDSKVGSTQVKLDSNSVKLNTAQVKGESKSLKLDSKIQKGDMP